MRWKSKLFVYYKNEKKRLNKLGKNKFLLYFVYTILQEDYNALSLYRIHWPNKY